MIKYAIIYIKSKMKKVGFTAKMFIGVFFFGIVLITTMQLTQLYNLNISQRQVIERQISDDIEKCERFFDNYYDMVIQLLISLSTRNDIFTLPSDEVDTVLNSITSPSMLLKALYIMQDDGSIVSSRQSLLETLDNSNLEQAMRESRQYYNAMRYTKPYVTQVLSEYSICFIFPLQTNTNRIIAIELNLVYVRDYLNQLLSSDNRAYALKANNGEVFLFDQSGEIIPVKSGTTPIQMTDDFATAITIPGKIKTALSPSSIPGYRMMFSDDNKFDWFLYAFWSEDLLKEVMAPYYSRFFSTTAQWVFALAVFGFVLMFFFTRPLRKLTQAIEQVRGVESLIPLENKREDEIGRLTNSYNHLVVRIQELIEDIKNTEREKSLYEFRMLQNQIGPHFLHNVLACTGSLIRQGQSDKAAMTVRSLSALLSYSFSFGQAEVVLSEELKYLGSYLDIQKIRHGDIFNILQEISDKANNCIIPKLTLQPLVENAILHGLLPKKESDRRIIIRAFIVDRHLLIFIADNGIGMSPEKLAAVLNGTSAEASGSRFSSIGLSNVNERMRLSYGDNYKLKIRSCYGKGTVVRIKIPMNIKNQ